MSEESLFQKSIQYAKEIDERIPFYVFDIDSFHKRLDDVREKLYDTKLVFAIKANPFLTGISDKHVDYFEVCSSGELEVCINESINLKKVVYTGVLKTKSDVEYALDSKVGFISVESENQLELIKGYCRQKSEGDKVKVILRCASDRFGMEDDQILHIISKRKEYEALGIIFVALQQFTGTQKKIDKTINELEELNEFAGKLESLTGWRPQFLELGAGLKLPYFINQQGYKPYEELDKLIDKMKSVSYPIHLELGRYITAPCGYYFTTVLDVKKHGSVNYALLNGGIGHITYYQSNMGMRIPVIIHLDGVDGSIIPNEDKQGKKWTLCGPICSTLDTVAKDTELTKLKLNDYLVFTLAGAYSMTWSNFLFLSRPMPEIIFYLDEELKVVRGSIKTSTLNTVT